MGYFDPPHYPRCPFINFYSALDFDVGNIVGIVVTVGIVAIVGIVDSSQSDTLKSLEQSRLRII